MPTSEDGIPQLGWSMAGNLQVGNTNAAVSLQVDFPIPDYYTVQFGILPFTDPTATGPFTPEATIDWVVAGNFIQRRISVGQGSSISGTGQACRVVLRDVTNTGGVPGGIYGGTILITPGSRPAKGQPPILWAGQAFNLAAAAGQTIMVPLDAGVISVDVEVSFPAGTVLTDVDVQVRQLDIAVATVLKQYNRPVAQNDFVPLVPGCGSLRITNNHASATAVITVIWGIDG